MEYRNSLLQGTALVTALAGWAATAQAQPVQTFVFGISSGVVTATAPQSPAAGAMTALSAQYNENLALTSSIDTNTVTSATGATVAGGPTTILGNVMSAAAIANQFSSVSGNTYTVDPSYAPTGGTVAIGSSQLNYNTSTSTVTNIARLGAAGVTTPGTPATPASTGTFTTGTPSYIDFTVAGSNFTVTGTPPAGSGFTVGQVYVYDTSGATPTLKLAGTGPDVLSSVTPDSTTPTTSTHYTYGSTPTTISTTGSLAYVPATATYTPAVASTPSSSSGALGNSITSVNSGTYGAPVNVDSNQLTARLTGNLNISAVSGAVPLTALSTGTASVQITGIAAGTPAGTAITVLAPVSTSNVQQNIAAANNTTQLTASVVNSLISTTFDGTSGYTGGAASVSSNTISATASANSAQPSVNLTAALNPTFTGGAAIVSAQGNDATASGAALTLTAENVNSTVVIQALSSGTLTQFGNSSAALNNNTVSSRAVLNDLTGVNLTTASTLAAGGTRGLVGTAGTVSTLQISPNNSMNDLASGTATTSTTTMRANTDYLNAALQNNNTVTAAATVTNSITGFFGGVSNGAATVQGNAITSTLYGNNAEQTTTLPLLGGSAQTITTAAQRNSATTLNGTVEGTQLRISDSFAATSDLSTATFTTVATATTGSSFTGANLSIGSATDSSLGNAVRSTVFGNNATLTTNVERSGTSDLRQAFATYTTTASLPTGSLVEARGGTIAALVQNNSGTAANANINQNAVSTGNTTFQIDAYQDLTNGTATIGNNVMRATAAGNVGTVTANVGTADSNLIRGGVTVLTAQGNSSSSSSFAGLGNYGDATYGGAASIGVGNLTNSSAQVVNNSFGAVAAGNSATGALNLEANSIASGNGTQATVVNSATTTSNAGYLVANTQVNSTTSITASNLTAGQVAAADALAGPGLTLAGAPADPFAAAGGVFTLNSATTPLLFASRMNVGAMSFSNATASVAGNTISTLAMGNAFEGSVSGFVTPGKAASGSTTGSLAVTNVQNNIDTPIRSGNVINGFIVSTSNTAADGTAGQVTGQGSNTTNSVLSVTSNTVSASASGNTATLAASGIALQGTGSATTASLQYTPGSGLLSSTGTVLLANSQANNLTAALASTTELLASTSANVFTVGWSNQSTASTGSVFRVDSNSLSAAATANVASLTATLATGPSYAADVGLNNLQTTNGASSSNRMTVAGTNSNALFGAGWTLDGNSDGASVANSTVSTSSNRVSAAATANSASLASSAPSTVLVAGGAMTNNYSNGTDALIAAGMGTLNRQTMSNADVFAGNQSITFGAAASASNSNIAINSNTVDATARGNTASTAISLPRLDGSAGGNNTQSVTGGTIAAGAGGVTFEAANSFISDTTNSPVSVSNNTVSATATASNYTATLSGLGQTGTPTALQATASGSVGGPTAQVTSGDVSLVSAQAMSNATATTTVDGVVVTVQLSNANTTNSTLNVNSNAVTATSNGNVSAQSILANGTGAANSRGGYSIVNTQAYGRDTNTETSATVKNVEILVDVTSTVALGASPVSLSSNSLAATATANSSSLSTLYSSMRSAGTAIAGSATADGTTAGATADYVQVNRQAMSGVGSTASSTALVSGSTISTVLVNNSTTNAPITLSNNTVTATANGNVTAMSTVLNTDGLTSSNRGTAALNSLQTINTATITGTVTGQNISATADGTGAGVYIVTNSPVALNGNAIGSNAAGNSASQSLGYASANRASGTGSTVASSVSSAASSSSNADYGLLNYQTMSSSSVAARTTGSNISYAGAATNGPVNLQGNLIYASAFGNSASMTMAGPQAGGTLQSTNYQSNTNTSVTAAVTGSNIAASMASVASSNAPINVSGNAIRAVAVGNSVTNAIGR